MQLTIVGGMRRTSFTDMNCSIAQCLEAVGEWWTLLIVRDALMGVTRFEDFHSRLGISRNILSMRLEHLVAHGILEKEVYQENPRRHRYLLTGKGRDLWLVVTAMRQWGDKWAGKDGPPVELVHRGCGRVTTVEPACSECGALIDASELYPVLGPGARTPDVIPGG